MKVRKFKHVTGFIDNTAEVHIYENDTTKYLMKDGTLVGGYPTYLHSALMHVKDGAWKEIVDDVASPPPFRNMKFRIENPEQSVALQEKLFSMGYKWDDDSTDIMCEGKFLFTSSGGNITYCDFAETYEALQYSEQEITTVVSVTFKDKPAKLLFLAEPIRFIEFDGKQYDEKAFKAAIDGLEIVEEQA